MSSRTLLSLSLALALAALAYAQPPRDMEKGRPFGDPTQVDAQGDPLPEGARLRLGTSRLRSEQGVSHLAFAPGGKELLTATYSNKLTFWDIATGKKSREWTVGTYSVYGLAFDKEGKTLAVAGGDSSIRILDAKTGAERKSLSDPNNRGGNISVVLSPDGKFALMLHRYNRQAALFDVEKGTVKHRFQNISTYTPGSFAFTADSKSFVGLWTDNRLNLVDVESGKARNLELNQPAGNVQNTYSSRIASMALTPDGKHLVYRATNERNFNVVELANGKRAKAIDRGTGQIYNNGTMTITPNSRFFMEAAGESAVRIWGLASGKPLRELAAPTSVYQHAMSADGKMVAASSGNCIFLWDVSTGKQLHAGHGHSTQVNRLAFSGDGKFVMSVGGSTMRVWDLSTGKEVHNARAMYGYNMFHFTMSDDGKVARWVDGSSRAVFQWRVGVDPTPTRLTNPRNLNFGYYSQAVSPDGKWMAAVNSNDRKVRLIDLLGNTADRDLGQLLPNAYSNTLTFSPDGRRLAIGSSDRSITIFDVKSAEQLRKIPGETNPGGYYYSAPQVHFSGDSRSIVAFDGEVKLIEAQTGSERRRLPRDQTSSPNAVVWSRDSRLLARSSYDGTVSVVDMLTGTELMRRQTGQGPVYGLAFSKDGRQLATGGANTTVMVWDVKAPGRPTVAGSLDEKTAWRDLEDPDAGKSHRAMVYLYGSPNSTMKLFRANLKPRQASNPSRIVALIKELDDDRYIVREKASDELAELGTLAEEALKEAVKGDSLEVRRRAQDVLRRMKGGTGVAPERLRAYRAVEVLEMIGTAEARQLLRDTLKYKIDKALEESIKESLARLGEPLEDPTRGPKP